MWRDLVRILCFLIEFEEIIDYHAFNSRHNIYPTHFLCRVIQIKIHQTYKYHIL